MTANKQTDTPESDWQTIGELELPDGTKTIAAVQTWLTEILIPLQVSKDFLKRFSDAVRASVVRATKTGELASRVIVLISIFVQNLDNSTGTSWGFFQIERTEMGPDAVDAHIHAIDFYLYVEGD